MAEQDKLSDTSKSSATPHVKKIMEKIDEMVISIKSLASSTKRIGRYQTLSLKWDQQHQRNIRAAAEAINTIVDVLRQKAGVTDLMPIVIEEDPSLMSEPGAAIDVELAQEAPITSLPANVSLHDILLNYATNATYANEVSLRLRQVTDDDFLTLDARSAEVALMYAFRWASDDFPDKSQRATGLLWIKAVASKFPSVLYQRAFRMSLVHTMQFVDKEIAKFPGSHEYGIYLRSWRSQMSRFLDQ